METQNLAISFDYSWFLAKNLDYAECWIMKFHYRNSSRVQIEFRLFVRKKNQVGLLYDVWLSCQFEYWLMIQLCRYSKKTYVLGKFRSCSYCRYVTRFRKLGAFTNIGWKPSNYPNVKSQFSLYFQPIIFSFDSVIFFYWFMIWHTCRISYWQIQ